MSELTEDHEYPDPLLLAISERLRSLGYIGPQYEPFSIYRVPPSIREADPSAYEPQIISIGPYHHKDPRLQATEDHKLRYMHNLLARRPQSDQSDFTTALKGFIEKVKQSEARARRYYSDPVYLSSDDFVMMMVLDGCFVLELILTFPRPHRTREKDDPIHSAPWMLHLVWHDLLKLENQIPFFVLEDLFDVVKGPSVTDSSLKDLTIFYLMAGGLTLNRFGEKQQVVYHLLHLYDLLLQPTDTDRSITNKPSSSSSVKSIIRKMKSCFSSCSNCILPTSRKFQPFVFKLPNSTIPPVVELVEVGIKFRSKKRAKDISDVTFRDGTFYIPPLSVYYGTNSVFRNLVAFEQCCPYAGHHISSYTMFLDSVINTAKDVTILQQHGIIDNVMGSEKEVALLINQLGKEVHVAYTTKLVEVYEEVNRYRRSKWHKYRASLVRDYCGSPWASISVVAAAALLLMTAAQVVFAVLSYLKQ